MRDLLVYLDDTPASPPRLEAAMALAEGLGGAHLAALCLLAEPYLRGTGAQHHLPAEIVREHLAHVEAEADKVLAAAREAAAARDIALETLREVGSIDRLPYLLARHARHVDLTIVGQANVELGGFDDGLLAEAAFMDSGRPALVVPAVGAAFLPPRRALIAWDGSREAARATADAVPLLCLAERTVILIVDGRDVSGHPGDRPGEEIVTHLIRHEVRAEVKEVRSGSTSIGEVVLAQAAAEGADLVVMGGYGHSRLRERLLGGVTRDVLEHLTVPTLLSH